MPSTPEDAQKEREHFASILRSFDLYAQYALGHLRACLGAFHALPAEQRRLLEAVGYKDRLRTMEDAVRANEKVVRGIREEGTGFLQGMEEEEEEERELEKFARLGCGHDHSDGGHSHSHSHDHSHNHSNSHDALSLPEGMFTSDRSEAGIAAALERMQQQQAQAQHGDDHGHDHSDPSHSHSHSSHPHTSSPSPSSNALPPASQMDKLLSTLKQFVRDWSAEGAPERESSYGPLLRAVDERFGSRSDEEKLQTKILLPGAGLGRLAFEVARRGYAAQGNEFSYFMLLSSFFVLNRTDSPNAHTLFPYLHSASNHPSARSSQLKAITVPDVLPAAYLGPGAERPTDFSLVAGEFLEVYGGEEEGGEWDAVVCCFWLDTAKNIVDYLRTIKHVLKPGGLFINLGPLLWHWENNTEGESSIELTLEELKALVKEMGFRIEEEKTVQATYTGNPESMLKYVYDAAFWVAVKE